MFPCSFGQPRLAAQIAPQEQETTHRRALLDTLFRQACDGAAENP
jgi:hypothetical protein